MKDANTIKHGCTIFCTIGVLVPGDQMVVVDSICTIPADNAAKTAINVASSVMDGRVLDTNNGPPTGFGQNILWKKKI